MFLSLWLPHQPSLHQNQQQTKQQKTTPHKQQQKSKICRSTESCQQTLSFQSLKLPKTKQKQLLI